MWLNFVIMFDCLLEIEMKIIDNRSGEGFWF